MLLCSSTEVKPLKITVADLAGVASVAFSHDILNVLLCHWVIKMVSEDTLQITGLDAHALKAVENMECICSFALFSLALVPTIVDNSFKEIEVKARA